MYRKIRPIHMSIGDPLLRMPAVYCLGKTYVPIENRARGRTRS